MSDPGEIPVESLGIDFFHVARRCPVKQLYFVVASVVLVHFLFPQLIGLVKQWILNPLYTRDGYSACSLLKCLYDALELGRVGCQSDCMHGHFIPVPLSWHWRPAAGQRNSYYLKTKA